jgi:hypothetical protein
MSMAELIPGDPTIARLKAQDAERVAQADPIYPGYGDRALDAHEAVELAAAFRALRDARRGELVAPRSDLPASAELVADALLIDGQDRVVELDGSELKAAQRELAEAFVDLQSFRPDEQAARILEDPSGAADELRSLSVARAAMIGQIREDDMSVLGNMNALRGLDLRIGDGRIALDAVNRYREKQALGLLAMIGIPVFVVIALAVIVILLVIRPGL